MVPSLLISLLLVATTVVSDRSEDQRHLGGPQPISQRREPTGSSSLAAIAQERLARLAAHAQQHGGGRGVTQVHAERPRIAQQDDAPHSTGRPTIPQHDAPPKAKTAEKPKTQKATKPKTPEAKTAAATPKAKKVWPGDPPAAGSAPPPAKGSAPADSSPPVDAPDAGSGTSGDTPSQADKAGGKKVWPGGSPSDTATFASNTAIKDVIDGDPGAVPLAAPPDAATLTQGTSQPISIVSKATLVQSVQDLNMAMSADLASIATKMQSLFTDVSQTLQGENQKMFEIVSYVHMDSEERIRILLKEERRLEVTMMHGAYGKCCCKNESAPGPTDTASSAQDAQLQVRHDYWTPATCTWSPVSQLVGNFTKACAADKEEYTEFLGRPESGGTQDTILDLCSKAPAWKQFTNNQILNDCDDHSNGLKKTMATLGSYIR